MSRNRYPVRLTPFGPQQGRVTEEAFTDGPLSGIMLERQYDSLGRQSALILHRGQDVLLQVGSGYTGNTDRLAEITHAGLTHSYGFRSDSGQISGIEHKQGGQTRLHTVHGHDAELRLASVTATPGLGSALQYGYAYDSAGRRNVITLPGGHAWAVAYQSDGQIESYVLKDGTEPVPGYSYEFNHSGIGSRTMVAINDTQETDRTAEWIPNQLNQITNREIPGYIDIHGVIDPPVTEEPPVVVTATVSRRDDPVTKRGTWESSTTPSGHTGPHYLHDDNTGKGEKWVDFRFPVGSGHFEVEVIWPDDPSHSTATPVTVRAGAVMSTLPLDQTQNGSQWMTRGTYELPVGGTIRVRIGTQGTSDRVVADAVRVTRLDTPSEPWSETLYAADAVPAGVFGPAVRSDKLFYLAAPVDNTTGPVEATVDITGVFPEAGVGGSDAIATEQRSVMVPPSDEVLQYDADGNRSGDWRWSYEWNAAGRLSAMKATPAAVDAGAPDQRLEFEYDAGGRRVLKTVSQRPFGGSSYVQQSKTYFIYDGWNLIAELDDNLNLVRSYTWGLDLDGSVQGLGGVGALLAIHTPEGDFLPVIDGSGNLTGLVNADTGEVVARYQYGAFGEVLSETGSAAMAQPFRFSTKYEDTETGLLYYGFRYLDPVRGIWLSREPLGELESPNLYAFVGNDPVNAVDVLGLFPWILVDRPVYTNREANLGRRITEDNIPQILIRRYEVNWITGNRRNETTSWEDVRGTGREVQFVQNARTGDWRIASAREQNSQSLLYVAPIVGANSDGVEMMMIVGTSIVPVGGGVVQGARYGYPVLRAGMARLGAVRSQARTWGITARGGPTTYREFSRATTGVFSGVGHQSSRGAAWQAYKSSSFYRLNFAANARVYDTSAQLMLRSGEVYTGVSGGLFMIGAYESIVYGNVPVGPPSSNIGTPLSWFELGGLFGEAISKY